MSKDLLETSIHTLNTSTHVYFDMIKYVIDDNSFTNKKELNISPFQVLRKEFHTFNRILEGKGIKYSDLKTVLIPTQKKKKEVLFIFDASKLSEINAFYGKQPYLYILSKLSLFKKSSFVVYKGDLIIKDKELRKTIISYINTKKSIVNKLDNSARDYYFIYIKGLSDRVLDKITKEINHEKLFYNGHIVCNNEPLIKSIVSKTLIQDSLINKESIILSNPEGNDNKNLTPFDYNLFGYRLVGIHDFYYYCFLTYKIENILFDKNEINNAVNFTHDKEVDITNFDLIIDKEKYDYIMTNKNLSSKSEDKKNKKMYESNLSSMSFMEFYNFIEKILREGDIFNIELTAYGIKFNKKVVVQNDDEKYYTFIAAFEIKEENRRIRLVTMY